MAAPPAPPERCKVVDGKIQLLPGQPKTPEVDSSRLTDEQVEALFAEIERRNNRKCFACPTDVNLGCCIRVMPTNMPAAEKERQSAKDKARASSKAAAASAAAAAEVEVAKPDEYYNPYPIFSKPSPGISPPNGRMYHLVPKFIPAYICVDCRRAGEPSDTRQTITINGIRVEIPTPKERNLINKYEQSGVGIVYIDEDGERYFITDRLQIIVPTGVQTAQQMADSCEDKNMLQQLCLLTTGCYDEFSEFAGKDWMKSGEKFTNLLSEKLRRVIPALLTSILDTMCWKIGAHMDFREMAPFEEAFVHLVEVLRFANHFLTKYPSVRTRIMHDILLWNWNPVSQTASELFNDWLAVVYLAPLCGVPMSTIQRSVFRRFMAILDQNYSIPIGTRDPITYLRTLLANSKNHQAALMMTFATSVAHMITRIMGDDGNHALNAAIDARGNCTLPQSELMTLWQEMKAAQLNREENPAAIFEHFGQVDVNGTVSDQVRQSMRRLDENRRYTEENRGIRIPREVLDEINSISVESLHRTTAVGSGAIRRQAIKRGKEEHTVSSRALHSNKYTPLKKDGSPYRLTDAVCAYCKKEFKTASGVPSRKQLRKHLREEEWSGISEKAFSQDLLHRTAFGSIEYEFGKGQYIDAPSAPQISLTPDQIIEQRITTCPLGSLCTNSHAEEPFVGTPEEVCQHLANYGIRPFYPRWLEIEPAAAAIIVSEAAAGKREAEADEGSRRIPGGWETDDCVICLEKKPERQFVPCGHACLCSGCIDAYMTDDGKECPLCRTIIAHSIPIRG